MARIVIELPEHFTYATEIPFLNFHANYSGHLDNAMVLAFVSEARVRYLKSLGYAPANYEGVGIIVCDAALQYKSEAFYGKDEVMVMEMAARDFNKYGFDFVWRLSDKASGREIARGKTGILCLDKTTRKVTLIPEKFQQRLQAG